MDECGVQIGVAKNQYVYTKHSKQVIILGFYQQLIPNAVRQIFIPHSNNYEQVSLVKAISTGSVAITLIIIVKAVTILESWIMDLPDNYLMHKSKTGYSNDEISLDWIKHFNKMTQEQAKGKWRLLLMDRYESHFTREFIEYTTSNKIQLQALSLYTTHFLQPLDVGVSSH